MQDASQAILFGGTFDPVHHGHLIIARAVAEQTGCNRIIFVPTADPPHKNKVHAAGEHRLAMLRLALQDQEWADVSAVELQRQGRSYTYETVKQFLSISQAGGQIRWLVGADMLEDLPNWYRVGELLELADIVTAVRPPWYARLAEIFADLESKLGRQRVERLKKFIVQTPMIEISASEIRQRVKESKSIQFLTPDSVVKYIAQNKLYKY